MFIKLLLQKFQNNPLKDKIPELADKVEKITDMNLIANQIFDGRLDLLQDLVRNSEKPYNDPDIQNTLGLYYFKEYHKNLRDLKSKEIRRFHKNVIEKIKACKYKADEKNFIDDIYLGLILLNYFEITTVPFVREIYTLLKEPGQENLRLIFETKFERYCSSEYQDYPKITLLNEVSLRFNKISFIYHDELTRAISPKVSGICSGIVYYEMLKSFKNKDALYKKQQYIISDGLQKQIDTKSSILILQEFFQIDTMRLEISHKPGASKQTQKIKEIRKKYFIDGVAEYFKDLSTLQCVISIDCLTSKNTMISHTMSIYRKGNKFFFLDANIGTSEPYDKSIMVDFFGRCYEYIVDTYTIKNKNQEVQIDIQKISIQPIVLENLKSVKCSSYKEFIGYWRSSFIKVIDGSKLLQEDIKIIEIYLQMENITGPSKFSLLKLLKNNHSQQNNYSNLFERKIFKSCISNLAIKWMKACLEPYNENEHYQDIPKNIVENFNFLMELLAGDWVVKFLTKYSVDIANKFFDDVISNHPDNKVLQKSIIEIRDKSNFRWEKICESICSSLVGENTKLFSETLDEININEPITKSSKAILHLASEKPEFLPCLKILLKRKGLNSNVQDSEGSTALHISLLNKNLEAAELLLKHGADINIKDNNGKSFLDILKSSDILARAVLHRYIKSDNAIAM